MFLFLRTAIIITIFCCALLPEGRAVTNSTALDSLEIAKSYYERGLSFSSNKMIRLLLKANRNTQDSLFIGELYKWQAFNFYEQGLVTQYAAAIDSMWLYKQAFGKPYYIEYTSMLLRLRALKHDYENIDKQLDSADVVFYSLSLAEKSLIDTFFYKINVENIYRNYWGFIPKEQHENFYHKIRLPRLFQLRNQFLQLPHSALKPTYALFMGNFFQDYLSNPGLTDTFYTKTVFNACISSYQWVIDWSKSNNYHHSGFVARAYLLQSLQYMYRSQFDVALERLNQMQQQIEINALGQSFYLGGVFPLHYYQYSYRACSKAGNINALKELLKYRNELHRLRFYYNEHYRVNQSELFINGYPPQAHKEEAGVLFEVLLVDSTNEKLQDNLWQNLSTYTHYEAFYHRIRLQIGEEKYDSLSCAIVQSSRQISEALEQYVILDSTYHETAEANLQKAKSKYDSLVESNTHLKQLIEGSTIFTLKEAQQNLEADEAQVHFLFPSFGSDFKVCIVTKANFNLVDIPGDEQLNRLIYEIAEKYIENQSDTMLNAAPFYEIYKRIFQPLTPYLKGIQRLNILGLNNHFTLPLEQLVTKSVSTYYQKPPLLAQRYAIRYTSNLAVNYLNARYYSVGPNRIVQPSTEFLQKNPNYAPIPFSNQLTNWLTEQLNVNSYLNTSKELMHSGESDILHFSTHGIQNKTLRTALYYKTQSALNENYIVLDDQLVSIEAINNSRIKANLVVLGSCDIGHGLSQIVSGSYNFGRVFIANGSNTVIKSAYPIDDYTTSFILKQFYTYLLDGEFASIALQRAKIDFLNQCTDPALLAPFYWASLILEGNDIKLQQKPWYETYYLLIALLAVGGILFAYFMMRKTRKTAA